MLGAATELLYVGKARDLRRRLQQHDRAAPRPGTRPHDLYQRVREVRWETTVDDATAADREADLVVGLRPPFNASLTGDGRWVFVVVRATSESAVRFDLADDVGTGAGAACVRVLPAPGCRRELGARDCLQRGLRRVPADPLGRVRRTRPSLPRRDRRKLAAGDVHGRRTRSAATRVACLHVGNEPAPARGARRRGRPPRSLHAARARSGSGVGRRVLHPRPGRAARAPPPPRTPRAARAASDDRSAARARSTRRDRRLHDPRAARSDGGTPRCAGFEDRVDRCRASCRTGSGLEPAPTARPARRSRARSARAQAPGGTRYRQIGASRTTVEDLRPETGSRRTTNSTARSERQVRRVRGRVRERETLKWHIRDRCKGD